MTYENEKLENNTNKIILFLTITLLCWNISAQEKHKTLPSKSNAGSKKILEPAKANEEKETTDNGSESRFFNFFVHSNTFNEFVEGRASNGNITFTIVNEKVEVTVSEFLEKTWGE